jgi:aminopeptidase N
MTGRRLALALLAAGLALQPLVSARQAAPAAPARSPRNANYTLQASLDPATHTLTGKGRVTWRNITKTPASELRFHLYWNAWRNTSSSWMREDRVGRNSGLAGRPAGDWASIDLTTLALAGGGDLLSRAAFIAPDDGNRDDRTVLAVPLTQPVAPGETIAIDLAWTSHVPRTFARTGVIGDYYFIGQWFPKLGVLQDAGWNCHQFHAATEFFSDFGVYDVTLGVPKYWPVGATGREIGVEDDPAHARTYHHFVQNDVHDFAWTTSPDFLEAHQPFDEPGLPRVDMRLLLQKEHGTTDQIARHFNATRVALKYYGTWFGAYPYDHITIVDPVAIVDPAQGASTGGMEYPTLFTAGSRWFAPKSGLTPEGVTIHEAGHQFWYGIVATNEFEDAWMDEGLNSFSQARAMAEGLPAASYVAVDRYFGGLIPWAYADVPWSRDVDGGRISGYRPVAGYEVQATPTWRYALGSASQITYSKTALWMATLEKYLGWPTLQKILAAHFARGAFEHPTPEQFFAIANEVSGQDLTWFFDAVYRSSAVFDYGVDRVVNVPAASGVESTVIVRRYGDGIFPIDVRVTFGDGSTVIERWDGRDRWRAFTYRKPARVTTVEVDPRRVLLLDVNYTNNSWTSQAKTEEAARKWSLRWLTWLEEVLLSYAYFS